MDETPDLQIKNQVSPSSELDHIRHALFLRMDLLYVQFARQLSLPMDEIPDLQIKNQLSPTSELDHIRNAMFLRMDLIYFQFARQKCKTTRKERKQSNILRTIII